LVDNTEPSAQYHVWGGRTMFLTTSPWLIGAEGRQAQKTSDLRERPDE